MFTLKDHLDCNYNIMIDIIYIKDKLVLYLVDKKIHF